MKIILALFILFSNSCFLESFDKLWYKRNY